MKKTLTENIINFITLWILRPIIAICGALLIIVLFPFYLIIVMIFSVFYLLLRFCAKKTSIEACNILSNHSANLKINVKINSKHFNIYF
jgi:hypothetical protein